MFIPNTPTERQLGVRNGPHCLLDFVLKQLADSLQLFYRSNGAWLSISLKHYAKYFVPNRILSQIDTLISFNDLRPIDFDNGMMEHRLHLLPGRNS